MKHSNLTIILSKPAKQKKKTSSQLALLFHENSLFPIWNDNQIELLGIVNMVDGLEYHHKKFKMMEKKYFSSALSSKQENMIHEAIAYLNRLCQIEKLIISKWFRQRVSNEKLSEFCPTIFALMPFRNKHSAHRSIDEGRRETPSQLESQASIPFVRKSMSKIGDQPFVVYSIKIAIGDRHVRLKNIPDVKTVEISREKEIFLNFILSEQHSVICSEILLVLRAFFTESVKN